MNLDPTESHNLPSNTFQDLREGTQRLHLHENSLRLHWWIAGFERATKQIERGYAPRRGRKSRSKRSASHSP